MTQSALSKSYSSPATTIRRYWASYGGCRALLLSPYFHAALALSVPCAIYSPLGWIEKATGVIPSILGFSLGGYAILLALGSGEFFERLRKPRENDRASVLEGISTSFFHFVIVQMVSLVLSLLTPALYPLMSSLSAFVRAEAGAVAGSLMKVIFCTVGWVGLFYSLTCALALTFRLYRMVQLASRVPVSPTETPK